MKNLKQRHFLFILLSLFTFNSKGVIGQHGSKESTNGSLKSLSEFIKDGKLHFHTRTNGMSTINEGASEDFFTIGQGLDLIYYTPKFHGFQIEVSGFMTFSWAEYNLINDVTSEYNNSRYEKALYDIHNPISTHYSNMLDEIILSYHHKDLEIKLGNQTFESPLLNKNYNRLRPNVFQGLSLHYEHNSFNFSAAWFISEIVRGTMHSEAIENTFGVYGQGINRFGESSNYHGNISTHGIGIIGVEKENMHSKSQLWNYTSENVFNLSFLQHDYKAEKENLTILLGGQAFYETPLNNGGNSDPDLAYIHKGQSTFGVGGQIGIDLHENHEFTFNYLGISDQGRYLFPREWGREKFYASQTTELFDGYGGLNAYVLRYRFNSKNKQHESIISGGIIDQPNIDNLRLNKYQLDDYYHFLIEHKYHFKNYFEGLDIRFLVTYKTELDGHEMTAQQRLNKVEMIHFNLVLDYHL